MRKEFSRWLAASVAVVIFGIAAKAANAPAAWASPQAIAQEAIGCRALEVHTAQADNAGSSVVIVIFHQNDPNDRQELGEFLKQHSEAAAQFQTTDGAWHDATVIRLTSCFGRGLLVFPAGVARLGAKDTFTLRITAAK